MPHLEHIGIAVKDAGAVAALYEKLLGVRPYKLETVTREGVQTHFISAETAKLELLAALGADSPVAKFLAKRGEGLHHLAFEVDDARAEMDRLTTLGFTPLSDAPRLGADGKLIFFLHPKETHGVLVEFCQSVSAMPAPTRVPYRDGHLAAFAFGSEANPPVVLLHGVGGSTELELLPVLRRLEPHFYAVALDFAGHGASDDFPDLDLSGRHFVDNARALLDFFDLDDANLFGFSMGGSIALALAHQHPARVRSLAVHGANFDWDARRVRRLQSRLNPDALARLSPVFAERLAEVHGAERWAARYRRLQAYAETLLDGPLRTADLIDVQQPVLVSAHDRDDLFPLEVPLALHHALPNASLALLPGTRHALATADPDVLAHLLRRHFTSLP